MWTTVYKYIYIEVLPYTYMYICARKVRTLDDSFAIDGRIAVFATVLTSLYEASAIQEAVYNGM
jgi:hypothetical protein